MNFRSIDSALVVSPSNLDFTTSSFCNITVCTVGMLDPSRLQSARVQRKGFSYWNYSSSKLTQNLHWAERTRKEPICPNFMQFQIPIEPINFNLQLTI